MSFLKWVFIIGPPILKSNMGKGGPALDSGEGPGTAGDVPKCMVNGRSALPRTGPDPGCAGPTADPVDPYLAEETLDFKTVIQYIGQNYVRVLIYVRVPH